MGYRVYDATFPARIWRGECLDRKQPDVDFHPPTGADWDTLLSNLIAMQEFYIKLKAELQILKGNQLMAQQLRIVQSGVVIQFDKNGKYYGSQNFASFG